MTSSPPTAPIISDYRGGRFVLGDQVHQGAVMILGEDISGFSIKPWIVRDRASLTTDDFLPALNSPYRPDLLIIGVGEVMDNPFMGLRRDLNAAGLPAEILTTAAACRTWNLLLSEGRKVALAALEVPERG